MQPAVDDPLVGTVIGRYRIEGPIAQGGMGRVYLGVQPEIGSRVAIKVLSEHCAEDPELVERFFAEARAVNLIAHENIVKVLDLATLDDGRPFIVMEHVDGVTLTAATRGGRAPLGGIVHVFLDVLSALGAAHAIGIVHRDLKPDNIMITAKGHAKVLDFGIAKLSPHHQPRAGARTVTGALLGTPAYMAPEQIADAGNVDARADIYAAGAVLFHAVTGRPPFGGATMFDIMRAQLEEEPPAPRSLRTDLPIAIERVIMRALAKEPSVRFASTVEMASALDEAAAELPDHQWFDLSRKTAPMRVRGSGNLTQPPPIQRDTPPAISVVNVPVPRAPRRWLAPIAIVGVLATAAAVFALLRTPASPQVATPAVATATPGGPAPAVATPDAIAPDAAIALVPVAVDAAVKPKRSKSESAEPDKAVAGTVTPSREPQVVRTDLGAIKKNLTYANTVERAHAIARMLPGVKTTRLLEVRVGGADVDAVDTTRGAWVMYRLTVDPPMSEGCHVLVRFAATTTIRLERGACDQMALMHPPRCSFTQAWQRTLVERDNNRPFEWIKLDEGGYAWESNDSHRDAPDSCQ